jgi:inner membrane protein
VLVRPYTQTVATTEIGDKGVKKTNVRKQELTATTFPRELDVRGAVIPNERRHGLYKVQVYEFQGELKGRLDIVDPPVEGTVVWAEPYLELSVADVRGIVGTPKVMVNGVLETMLQGAPYATGWQPNLRVPLHGMSGLLRTSTFRSLHTELTGWRSPIWSLPLPSSVRIAIPSATSG